MPPKKRSPRDDERDVFSVPLDRVLRFRAAAMTLASERLRPLDLGLKQAMLLGFLGNGRGPASPSDFCRATDTDPAAMVRLVDVLEKRGLLVRRDDPDGDRRRWALELTRAGETLAADVEVVASSVRRQVLSALSPREMRTLVSLLEKALRAFERRQESPGKAERSKTSAEPRPRRRTRA